VCGDWCTDDHAGHGLAAQVEQALDVEEVGGLRCNNVQVTSAEERKAKEKRKVRAFEEEEEDGEEMGSWGEASTTTYENDIKEETHLDLHELLVPRRNVVDRVLLLCRVGRRGRRLVLLVVLAVLDHLLQRLRTHHTTIESKIKNK
jgi:hypothetical protein